MGPARPSCGAVRSCRVADPGMQRCPKRRDGREGKGRFWKQSGAHVNSQKGPGRGAAPGEAAGSPFTGLASPNPQNPAREERPLPAVSQAAGAPPARPPRFSSARGRSAPGRDSRGAARFHGSRTHSRPPPEDWLNVWAGSLEDGPGGGLGGRARVGTGEGKPTSAGADGQQGGRAPAGPHCGPGSRGAPRH